MAKRLKSGEKMTNEWRLMRLDDVNVDVAVIVEEVLEVEKN